ncbi:isochorismatase family protein [Cohnella faecalis]|uniref:Isochorismatase family protein n=1 Tax=Cohnella faecalis TaxID=2315694 RepID=A0A398CPA7_9BACL|nr:isochorismatase family protein [Cohnella faecalis]RIE01737.1 isochorismatase family protein [Cohnella faecalis]
MKKALLIIDMQAMPFVWKSYGGKSLYQEARLIANTRLLIEKARKNASPIFYIMYTETTGPRSVDQPLWQIIDPIAPEPHDSLVIKYHADSFHETNLNALLRNHAIEGLVVCGIQTEYCVDTTVKSAYSHGYKVELASDCHSTYDSEEWTAEQIVLHHNNTLKHFASIVRSDEIQY